MIFFGKMKGNGKLFAPVENVIYIGETKRNTETRWKEHFPMTLKVKLVNIYVYIVVTICDGEYIHPLHINETNARH